MRIQVVLPAIAIAVLLAGNAFVLTQSDKTTPVTLEQAVDRFRDTVPSTAPAEPSAEAATTPADTAPAAEASVSGSTATRTAAAPAAQAASAAQPFAAPADGVYPYRARGYEEVSMGGARHDYPERTFATVRRQGGCRWEVRHEVLKEHVEHNVLCSEPGRLIGLESGTEIVFFGQRNGSTFRCDPPEVLARVGDQPGAKSTTTCRSEEDQATITTTFVGRERLTVGGVAVDALHLISDGTVSGRATGTSKIDNWIHPDTGLLLKSVRKVQSRADAFGSTVDYREDASFELERLEPLR
jgi:hypothetical protein